MTNVTKITTIKAIAKKDVDELRQTIRQSWITSVKAIYAFGKDHSRASIEASLKACNLSLTKKANEFTGAAKLGLSEKVNGKWVVCDGQISRYAKVCEYLNSRQIKVADVEKALKSKTMTELVQSNSKKRQITDAEFEQAVANIEQLYPASKLFSFKGESLPVKADAGLQVGANMAVVVCDQKGNIVAVRGLPNFDEKLLREKVVAASGKSEVAEVQSSDDLVNEITAEAA